MDGENPRCKRDGCRKYAARGDDYCSTFCCKVAHGCGPPPSTMTKYEKEKNRKRRQDGKTTVVVENTEAMNRAVLTGFETNKRKH